MKEEKGKGMLDKETGNWFCSLKCKNEFSDSMKNNEKEMNKTKSCCQ